MKKLTPLQEDLIQLLKMLGVEREAVVGIMLMLKTEETQLKLLDFIDKNREADQSDILGEVIRITG